MASPVFRRSLLAAAVGVAGGVPRTARAEAVEQASLLVAGPGDGRLSAWAAALTPPLLHGLPIGSSLSAQSVGGADGVTGANLFEARFSPAGAGLMLLPGAAALAWLAGDPRVHFDAARWLPLLCGVSPGVLACRRPLDPRPARQSARLPDGQALRVAVGGPLGPDAAALLALDLLGVPAVPVYGLVDPQAALAAGQVDAAFLSGPAAAVLRGPDALYCLGPPDGFAAADPLLPQLPTLAGMLAGYAGDLALLAAWRAAAAAAQLDYALVMALVSEPASVALWRRAATDSVGDAPQPAFRPGVRSLAAPACNTVLSAIAADSGVLLAYQGWLATRLMWPPG